MLHIHNGDSSANIARDSSLPGEHFAFREALVEGPTPANVSDAEWRKLRTQHLSAAYGVEFDEVQQGLLTQEQDLSRFREHDEVVLWFEHDLFCQVHLIYLLDWFGKLHIGNTKLSLICIGKFPDKDEFRGLGQLNPEELASLFPQREQVTAGHLGLASRAWETYRARDPRDIEALLQTDTSSLPFLGRALEAHLERFPSTRNGLGTIENTALQLFGPNPKRFDELFKDFASRQAIYGFGDAQLWLALRRMSDVGQPLLKIESGTQPDTLMDHAARFRLTDLGRTVLNGDADFVLLNGIDHWLGGVYLNDERNLWRWDETSREIVLT